jgi:hypothetical protein
MKPKHQGFAALLVLCLGLSGAGGFLGYRYYAPTNGNEPMITPQASIAPISVPGPEEVRLMEKLTPKLAELSVPAAAIAEPVTLTLFGYQPPRIEGGDADEWSDESTEDLTYKLTFTFSSGPRRFCIIDGDFYPNGGTLPDGARIMQIESHKVLVRKKESETWIPLADPEHLPKMRSMSRKPQAKPEKGG